jgi:lysophospholipase L1-like esterase
VQKPKFALGFILSLSILLISAVGIFSIPNSFSNWLRANGLYFYTVSAIADKLEVAKRDPVSGYFDINRSEKDRLDSPSQPNDVHIKADRPSGNSIKSSYNKIDKNTLNTAEKQRFDSLHAAYQYLYIHEESESLTAFFDRLNKRSKKGVRIWYYGDSQIEGDRITGEIRKSLQSYFGGTGMGFLPLSNPASYQELELADQSDWQKYNCFQHRKKNVAFGPSGLLFQPKDKSASKWNEIRIKISKSLKYEQLYLLTPSDTVFQVEWKGKKDSSWNPVKKVIHQKQIHMYAIGDSALHETLTIRLRGTNVSVYGLSLEGPDKGIQLDNFGIRGHSGDGLKLMSNSVISSTTESLGTGLVIFNLGNNIITYIKTDPKSEKWAKDIFRNIFKKYKTHCPDVSLMVIGPGDMGFQKSGQVTSYASCSILNQWMKEVSLEEGLCYFDFYQFILDKGGILGWRDAHLASLDGHLSPKGQRLFAKEFSKELICAFEANRIITKR